MVRLVGRVKNSGNQPQTGVLEVLADGRIYDNLSGSFVVEVPARFIVPDGDFSRIYPIEGGDGGIPEFVSSTSTSYRFRFFRVLTTLKYYDADNRIWQGETHEFQGATYTGSEHTEDSQVLRVERTETEEDLVPPFHARLPFSDQVSFFDLLPTGVTESNQDTSILAVATAIVTRPALMQPIIDAVLDRLG